ncbi:hypothetical protein SRB17_45910 [Streptomyces sp. RB17]|nr:hypothetical protein [Streptomyces sp. RB17]
MSRAAVRTRAATSRSRCAVSRKDGPGALSAATTCPLNATTGAATTDAGGRGLFLVARFASRWGVRYTPRGKVIWCEQAREAAGGGLEDMGDAPLDQWDEPAL